MKKICLMIALWLPMALFAATPQQQLTASLAKLRSMSANFKQQIKNERGTVLQTSSGIMALQRPNYFRWQISLPNRQTVIADGEKLWVYQPDLEQAVEKKISNNSSDAPGLLLSSSVSSLQKKFAVSIIKQSNQQVTYHLTPKGKSSLFKWVRLSFHGDKVTAMTLLDNLGQTISVQFSGIKVNPKLSAKLFHFKPPKGVDVVRE